MFNLKVNNDGSYRDFFGYTVICMLKDFENYKWIEDFLKKSILSKYYSPLPLNTYHMTTFNVWCQCAPLLRKYDEELKKVYKEQDYQKIKNAYNINLNHWYDPLNFMSILMINLENICNKYNWDTLRGKVKLTANRTIQFLIFLEDDKINTLNQFRNDCSLICGHSDHGLVMHLTLAYQYKNIPEKEYSSLKNELIKLSKLVEDLVLTFKRPEPYRFNSMINYIPESFWWN
jgi:hypothetical protein